MLGARANGGLTVHRTLATWILVPLLLTACGGDDAPVGPVAVEEAGYQGVILPASAWPSYAYEVEGFWTVSLEDVRAAEAALPAAAKRLVPQLTVPLDRYVRQYVGIVLEEGPRLYLNLLHQDAIAPHPDDTEEEHDAWRREVQVVDDGGDWYVEAFFDPKTGEFTSLWVHGEA